MFSKLHLFEEALLGLHINLLHAKIKNDFFFFISSADGCYFELAFEIICHALVLSLVWFQKIQGFSVDISLKY